MSRFCEVLKALRTGRGLTQAQLAGALGLKGSTVSMYEAGKREPDLATMEAIADYFQVDMDYLYGRSADPSAGKRLADAFFWGYTPTLEETAVAFSQLFKQGDSPNPAQLPIEHRAGVDKALEFFSRMSALPPAQREKVLEYLEFISQKEPQ